MQSHSLNTKTVTIYIRNMVSDSCIKVVKWELERSGFVEVEEVEIGRAVIHYNEGVINLDFIKAILERNGFGLINDKERTLVEQIKAAIIQLIFYGGNTNSLIRNSDYLSQKIGEPYPYLSKIFSKYTGSTLEKYTIQIKIEKVKELLSYDELSLSEISYLLGYSSVAHLSAQFKQLAGVTVHEYKKQIHPQRTPLNKI